MLEPLLVALDRLSAALERANDINAGNGAYGPDDENGDSTRASIDSAGNVTAVTTPARRGRKPKNSVDPAAVPQAASVPGQVFTQAGIGTAAASTPASPAATATQTPNLGGIQAVMAAARQQTAQDVAGISAPQTAPTYENFVRPAIAEVMATKGEPAVVAILQRYGVTRADGIPQNQWAEFRAYCAQVVAGLNPNASHAAAPPSLF